MTPSQKNKFENDLRILIEDGFDVCHTNEPNGQINVRVGSHKYMYYSTTGTVGHGVKGHYRKWGCKDVFQFMDIIRETEACYDA